MGGFRKVNATGFPRKSAFVRLAGLLLAGALALTLAACNLPSAYGGPIEPTSDPPPKVWIDAPNECTLLTGGTAEVVFYGSSAAGIDQGELRAGSQVIATLSNSETGSPQAVFRAPWTPIGPGRTVLQARVKDTTGRWSDFAAVTVLVSTTATPTAVKSATPTLAPTLAPTITRTPTTTLTPKPTLTPSIAPSPTPFGALGYRAQAWPAVFFTGNCTPDHVEFSAQVEPFQNVANLFLLARLEEPSSGARTPWSLPLAMGKIADGQYWYALYPGQIPGGEGWFPSATLLVQFVAMDSNYEVISRSNLFSTATLARCGVQPLGTAAPLPGRQVVTLEPVKTGIK